jgi:CRISPR/Cas system-associated exonuclease Cas4 (RecB family)
MKPKSEAHNPWQEIERNSNARAHKAEVSELRRQLVGYQQVVEELSASMDVFSALKQTQAGLQTYTIERKGKAPAKEAAAVVVASDWHVEESVDPKTVSHLNKFSLEVADKRIERFAKSAIKLIEIQRGGVDIPVLVLALLGDLMSGFIHEELREEKERIQLNNLKQQERISALELEVDSGKKRISALEMDLSSELYLHGYVDRLDVAPTGEVRIVDYKTGKSPKPGWEEKALFQLRVYALLYWKTKGVIPKLLQLIYMGDSRLVKSTPTENDLIKTERVLFDIAADILRAIERNEFRPRPTKLCDWCFFKTICPAHVG